MAPSHVLFFSAIVIFPSVVEPFAHRIAFQASRHSPTRLFAVNDIEGGDVDSGGYAEVVDNTEEIIAAKDSNDVSALKSPATDAVDSVEVVEKVTDASAPGAADDATALALQSSSKEVVESMSAAENVAEEVSTSASNVAEEVAKSASNVVEEVAKSASNVAEEVATSASNDASAMAALNSPGEDVLDTVVASEASTSGAAEDATIVAMNDKANEYFYETLNAFESMSDKLSTGASTDATAMAGEALDSIAIADATANDMTPVESLSSPATNVDNLVESLESTAEAVGDSMNVEQSVSEVVAAAVSGVAFLPSLEHGADFLNQIL